MVNVDLENHSIPDDVNDSHSIRLMITYTLHSLRISFRSDNLSMYFFLLKSKNSYFNRRALNKYSITEHNNFPVSDRILIFYRQISQEVMQKRDFSLLWIERVTIHNLGLSIRTVKHCFVLWESKIGDRRRKARNRKSRKNN